MDFLKSVTGGGHRDKPGDEGKKAGDHHHGKQSTTELLSSAKVVAEAARSAASNQSDKIDKGKAAGAAADLLDAASDKLGDKGVGQYAQKAGDYLHQYESKNSAGAPGHAKPSDHDHGHHAGEEHKPASDHHHEEKKSESEGGVGDYVKLAQGFLGKN